MSEYRVISKSYFVEPVVGYSVVSGNRVYVRGKQLVIFESGNLVEQYIYDIDGYIPDNGKSFVANTCNIMLGSS